MAGRDIRTREGGGSELPRAFVGSDWVTRARRQKVPSTLCRELIGPGGFARGIQPNGERLCKAGRTTINWHHFIRGRDMGAPACGGQKKNLLVSADTLTQVWVAAMPWWSSTTPAIPKNGHGIRGCRWRVCLGARQDREKMPDPGIAGHWREAKVPVMLALRVFLPRSWTGRPGHGWDRGGVVFGRLIERHEQGRSWLF